MDGWIGVGKGMGRDVSGSLPGILVGSTHERGVDRKRRTPVLCLLRSVLKPCTALDANPPFRTIYVTKLHRFCIHQIQIIYYYYYCFCANTVQNYFMCLINQLQTFVIYLLLLLLQELFRKSHVVADIIARKQWSLKSRGRCHCHALIRCFLRPFACFCSCDSYHQSAN